MAPPAFKGGQGRTDHEVRALGMWFARWILAAALFAVAAVACYSRCRR